MKEGIEELRKQIDELLEQRKFKEVIEKLVDDTLIQSKNAGLYKSRGLAYTQLQENDKAIADYTDSIKLSPDSWTYYYRGINWHMKGLNDKAKADINKALKLQTNLWQAYYGRGLVWESQLSYANAVRDFERSLKLMDEKSGVWVERAKAKVRELSVLLQNKQLTDISTTIDQIKKLLLFKDGCVTHYTSLSAAKELLLAGSEFRISEGAFLNDTSEGRQLFDFLNIEFTKRIDGKSAEQFAKKPFIGSFVEEKKHDDLNLWRMYGKENSEEAKGCALTIKAENFVESIKEKIASPDGGQAMSSEEEINFYRVAYRSEDTGNFIIPELHAEESRLNRLLQKLKTKVAKYYDEKKMNSEDMKELEEYLNRIAFLFKSDVYKSENELRLVVRDIAGVAKNIDGEKTPPKVFIKLVDIKLMIVKITLGPKVEKKDEWAAAFYYCYDGVPAESKPDILISHLPFK